ITTDDESGDLGCNPEVMAPMFEATDNCGVGEPIVTTAGPTNDGCAYSQTWTANVTDNCGNQAQAVSVTYTWTVDTEAPVITTNGTSGDLGCNPEIVPPMFKADDNCAGEIDLEAETSGPTNDGCAYSQTWTANYTDPCGNVAETVSVTYTWTVDTEAPVITTNGTSGDLGCNPKIDPPLFKVDDNCAESEMDLEAETSGPTNDGCAYSQTWTANYTDPCGNVAETVSVTYTWTVDTEAPEIEIPDMDPICNGIFPKNVTVNWTDNCSDGGELSAGPTNIIVSECQETADYVFTVTDECGNTATETLTLIREFDIIGECETAFGRSEDNSICFIPDFSRWGWTNYFEGEGEYTLQMYAGAAHCDISRGSYAGDVIVTYENGQVTLMFNIDSGYTMREAHVYVGCDMYPTGNSGRPTVAPGQYNFNPSGLSAGVSNYTVGPIDASGPIYVIAHAVVCEVTCKCSVSENEGGQFIPSNYDAINCGADLTNHEVPSDEITFTAYPVPFEREVFINYEYDFETDVTVEVFDVRGVVVRKVSNTNYVKGTEGTTRIDLSDANNQFYFVRLTTSKGTVTKKIVSSSPQRRD
ncbi:T9SS type A sorting domain-containing protein, partial [Hanstruepera ponticola]|uniref:T9SS type A sorting domain-containing protein n=1 Tax=Hanstruepera ponticola TaxID=2042995 RepID=UPI0013C3EA02